MKPTAKIKRHLTLNIYGENFWAVKSCKVIQRAVKENLWNDIFIPELIAIFKTRQGIDGSDRKFQQRKY